MKLPLPYRIAARASRIAFLLVALSVTGNEVSGPPQPLSVWLRDVAFMGDGVISELAIDPKTRYVSFVVTAITAWHGTAPRTVAFRDVPSYHFSTVGQRVVFLAFLPSVTRAPHVIYVAPMLVTTFQGRECFKFPYSSQAITPKESVVVPPLGTDGIGEEPPLVYLDAFRAAVRAARHRAA